MPLLLTFKKKWLSQCIFAFCISQKSEKSGGNKKVTTSAKNGCAMVCVCVGVCFVVRLTVSEKSYELFGKSVENLEVLRALF